MFDEALMTRDFDLALQQFQPRKREIVKQKVDRLLADPHHPSLRAHRLHRLGNQIWDCHIDHGHGGTRLLFEVRGKQLLLWRLGNHDVVDHAHQLQFDPATEFFKWEGQPASPAQITGADLLVKKQAGGEYWHADSAIESVGQEAEVERERNYFYFFREAQLRALGVPEGFVQAVKDAETLDEVFALPGLPALARAYLQQLAVSPQMKTVLLDPSQLLYRSRLDRLEGYLEGHIKKLMLNLEMDQQQYVHVRNIPLLLLKGTAGCGKTTIGIYHAIEMAAEGRHVLIVTYNRTLAAVTTTLIEELIGPLPDNLEVRTVHSMLVELLGSRFHVPDEARLARAQQFLSEALNEVRSVESAQVLKRDREFFSEEIQCVIKGLGLNSVEAYKAIRRYGRKTALGPAQREAVWHVYQAYQRRMEAAGLHEWSDAALLMLRLLESEKSKKIYDDIIVDEAQDLKPVDLRVIQSLVAPEGTLMVLGDAAQTLYSRGFSWVQAGISARGRTSILRINHRNTCQIAEAASQLIARNELMRSSNEYIDPLWTRRTGERPKLLTSKTSYQCVDLVYQQILELLSRQRCRLADIAILCQDNKGCKSCKEILIGNGLRAVLRTDPEFHIFEEQIKVMTIHSAKGLEFPVVFLMGLTEGTLPRVAHQSGQDEEEAQLEIERQRMLCYVGMTRAADLLYLVTVRDQESRFVSELAGKIER
ncbi:MAG TPA: 3'-5' exonuclease [Ktedonobacteraceae bacterium]